MVDSMASTKSGPGHVTGLSHVNTAKSLKANCDCKEQARRHMHAHNPHSFNPRNYSGDIYMRSELSEENRNGMNVASRVA